MFPDVRDLIRPLVILLIAIPVALVIALQKRK
jgi:hypothetical protein